MGQKVKVGIIGTGNIGTDILLKLRDSDILECGMFTGRNTNSNGINLAKKIGVRTSIESIKAIQDEPQCCDIIFDATNAEVHRMNAEILKDMGKFVIDLTPSGIGKMCVPVLNLEECIYEQEVNLITCGGQATVPIAHVISMIHPDTKYFEIVATIASRSAGAGTRNNIDEFTQTTREALTQFTNTENTKAIIILNPAEPPITMRNTVYALIDNPNMSKIKKAVSRIEKEIQRYVPGYHVIMEPTYENGRVTTTLQVTGKGNYLPTYAGNLDIITCAAMEIAENYAKRRILGDKFETKR